MRFPSAVLENFSSNFLFLILISIVKSQEKREPFEHLSVLVFRVLFDLYSVGAISPQSSLKA